MKPGITSEQDFDVEEQLRVRPDFRKYEKGLGHVRTPYFDLEKQEIIDPVHVAELATEIRHCTRIPQFEQEMIARRLSGQKDLAEYSKQAQQELI